MEKKYKSTKLKDVKIVSDMGISIEISPKDYKDLLISSNRLNALEVGGVDNWDWYSESLNDVDYDEKAKEIIAEKFKEKINDKLNEKKIMQKQDAINKIIQNLLDLLVEAKEAHHKLEEKVVELEWEISCLKK